jgi:5-keto 4-deoxyuronate isomerase
MYNHQATTTKILQEFCTQKMKANKTHKRMGSIKPQEKTSNQRIALTLLHNQICKQKQLNVGIQSISMNMNTEYQWNYLPHQKTLFSKLD